VQAPCNHVDEHDVHHDARDEHRGHRQRARACSWSRNRF
jgi:hypothetical protein